MPRAVPSQVVADIDAFFPWAKEDQLAKKSAFKELHRRDRPQVDLVLSLLDDVPDELLPGPSHPNDRLFRHAVQTIRTNLGHWDRGESFALQFQIEHEERWYSAFTLLRMILENCPDDLVTAAVSDLAFLRGDTDRQSDLARDMAEVRRGVDHGDWKSATVVGGAAIESLRLWDLDQKTAADHAIAAIATRRATERRYWKNPVPALENWDLYQFVAVAGELGIIGRETERQADLARDFRNYIHAGKVRRTQKRCDESTALLTQSALLAVVADMKKHFP